MKGSHRDTPQVYIALHNDVASWSAHHETHFVIPTPQTNTRLPPPPLPVVAMSLGSASLFRLLQYIVDRERLVSGGRFNSAKQALSTHPHSIAQYADGVGW